MMMPMNSKELEESTEEEEISNAAACGDLFDHIDDLLDFPKEDVLQLENAPQYEDGHGDPGLLGDAAAVKQAAMCSAFVAGEEPQLGCDDLDMAQLEWLSNFFDDSNDPPPPPDYPGAIKSSALAVVVKEEEDRFFSSCSPVSVLEDGSFKTAGAGGGSNTAAGSGSVSSSSSSSASSAISFLGEPSSPGPPLLCSSPTLAIPARARSKRSRPAAPRALTVPPLLLEPPAMTSNCSYSDPESIAESDAPPAKKKKKPKRALSAAALDHDYDEHEGGGDQPMQAAPARRCMHCQIEKTPQWRAGPMGPKTLCNACGVRYKSGRLFPEYRPAASPTFVPAIHSNSHKKVVEMRLKAASSDAACDLLQQIRGQRDL